MDINRATAGLLCAVVVGSVAWTLAYSASANSPPTLGDAGSPGETPSSLAWVDGLRDLRPGETIEIRRTAVQPNNDAELPQGDLLGQVEQLGRLSADAEQVLVDRFEELGNIKLAKAQKRERNADVSDPEAVEEAARSLYRAFARLAMARAVQDGRYFVSKAPAPLVMREDVYSAFTSVHSDGAAVTVTVFVPHALYPDVQAAHDHWKSTRRRLLDSICDEFNRMGYGRRREISQDRPADENQKYFQDGLRFEPATVTIRRDV